jgi:hypothetical protein
MRHFQLLLRNEFKLFRTSAPIHLVAILQPTLMYVLMAVTLVHPTFDMNVARPATEEGQALVEAMRQVGSPIGLPYINPILVDRDGGDVDRQVVVVENRQGQATAIQYFGLIDSNIVKNYRNRLTAAALRLWDGELAGRALVVEEHPWLPHDVPYPVYFGLAMLPLTAFLAASILGGVLTAQEFEFGTIVEYRLAPAAPTLIVGARLVRLVLFARWPSSCCRWPSSPAVWGSWPGSSCARASPPFWSGWSPRSSAGSWAAPLAWQRGLAAGTSGSAASRPLPTPSNCSSLATMARRSAHPWFRRWCWP